MRARRRTILAVLGFLLVLVGGLASLLGLIGFIDVVRKGGFLTTVGWVCLLGGPAAVVTGVVILRWLHRQRGPGESFGTATPVYAWSRRALIGWNLLFALGAVVTLGIGVTSLVDGVQHLVDGHGFTGHGGGLWNALIGVLFLGFGLAAATAWVFTVRRLDHQDPLFVVDDHGIECAHGRFAWRDIERVLQFTEVHGSGDEKTVERHLAFALREGASGQSSERSYEEENTALTPFGFRLEITNCTSQATSALASYGHEPVKGELSELAPEEPQEEPEGPPATPTAQVEPVAAAPETSGQPPFWPPPPGWETSSPPAVPVRAGRVKPPVRGVRRALLVALGLVLVLVGGLLTLGIVGASTSRNDKPTVGGLVAVLIIGLALVVGGGVLLYRLLRRGKAAEAPGTPSGIAPHSG